jgi:trehalose/maltose hydrolase-like predicted phosphorylase
VIFRGAVFDVDGVLVDSSHEQAWREGLRQFMENEWGDVRGETSYSPDKYKLTKQADAVLLFFFFPEDELKGLLERLGYDYTPEMVRQNYDRRTSHGSTLSFIAHASILAEIDPRSSWERYMVALESDVGDVQGGTTQEGIHLGVLAGTLDLIQRGYLGTVIRDGVLHFDPKLVGNLDGLSFPMLFHGTPLEVSLKGDTLAVALRGEGFGPPVEVRVGEEAQEIGAGERYTFGV